MPVALNNIKRYAIGAVLGSGGTATAGLWHYKTNDAAAVVEAANYFNLLVKELAVGDVIHASLNLGAAPALKTYVVTANNGAAVTVALQTVA